jgi:hypothetical protein
MSSLGQLLVVSHTDREERIRIISARTATRAENDFATMQGGVKGKYVRRYRSGTNLVLLDPDIAKAFPTDASVNEALRLLVKIADRQQ